MKIAVANGDGIGPEIMEAVLKIFRGASTSACLSRAATTERNGLRQGFDTCRKRRCPIAARRCKASRAREGCTAE